jgi:putative PIN family toxin of toxin-antitoxin system
MTRIILDSNVWAIYAYGNKLDRLASLAAREDIIIFISGQILKEVYSTCSKQVFLDRGVNPAKVIEILKLSGQLVSFKSLFQLSPDPDDNFLFDMYYQWYGDIIITEERALWHFWKTRINVRNIKWLKENYPH